MTKRNEQMAIITLEDFTHAVSIVVFPKTYGRYQQFVAVDMAVSISGDVRHQRRQHSDF